MRHSLRSASVLSLALALSGLGAATPRPQDPHVEGGDTRRHPADSALRERLNTEMMRLEREGALKPLSTLPWSPLNLLPPLPEPRAEALDGPGRVDAVARATVMFHAAYKCDRCANWHGGVATGFIVHPDGWVVTAAHVVKAAEHEKFCAIMLRDESVYPVRSVVAVDETRDVALVKIDATGLPALSLAGSDPRPGQDVWVMSHPQGHYYLMTDGAVSRLLGESEDAAQRLEITADFATGSSGAPVVDFCGNVVGMALSTVTLYADPQKQENPQLVIKQCVSVEDIRAVCEAGR